MILKLSGRDQIQCFCLIKLVAHKKVLGMTWGPLYSDGFSATRSSTTETEKLVSNLSQGNLPNKRWHLNMEGHIQQLV